MSSKESNEVERVAGFVAGNYACVYNGINGTLYAGNTALYFVGTFFLFEKKVIIPWERIRHVQKLDHGVAVICKNEEMHSFTNLPAPSRVWVILVSLHNDALLDHPAGGKRNQLVSPYRRASASRSMRRRNSDPASTLVFLDAREELPMTTAEEETNNYIEKEEGGADDIKPKDDSDKKTKSKEHSSLLNLFKDRPVINWFKELADPRIEDIEEKVGPLKLEPVMCSHRSYVGKLYAGNTGLFFYGRHLPWETEKVFIRFSLIRQFQIQGKEKILKRRGISIISKCGQIYDFEAMDNADRVWASLIALQNENLTNEGENMSRRQFSLRRMNSDPMMPSRMSFDESSEEPIEGEDLEDDVDSDDHASTASCLAKEPALNNAEDWATEVAKEKDFSNLVIKGETLHCSMEKFIELFIADGAPFSVAKFLESRGDLDLEASTWEAAARDNQQTRVIHYKHPVNAPLAPPLAGARKEQAFRRYGDLGLCLETKTIVDDVPMADCFYVADRVRITPKGKDMIMINMEFNITFIKSTMFKSIIGKTTQSEFTNLFESRKCASFYFIFYF